MPQFSHPPARQFPFRPARPLTDDTLAEHRERLQVPTYDRSALTPGAMVDYHFAPDDPETVLAALADRRTRLVTLTITGGGYGLDPDTGRLDTRNPELRAEPARPDRPGSVPGYLVEALARRRPAGAPPFTVLSCDNVPRNGAAARAAVVGFAALRDPELARRIDAEVSFPCSMVDRITPETTPEERAEAARAYGVDDRWPVITEPFSQWVVEDDFCAGRPAAAGGGGSALRARRGRV